MKKTINICPFGWGFCEQMCSAETPCSGWQKHLEYLEDPEYYNYSDPSAGSGCVYAGEKPEYEEVSS